MISPEITAGKRAKKPPPHVSCNEERLNKLNNSNHSTSSYYSLPPPLLIHPSAGAQFGPPEYYPGFTHYSNATTALTQQPLSLPMYPLNYGPGFHAAPYSPPNFDLYNCNGNGSSADEYMSLPPNLHLKNAQKRPKKPSEQNLEDVLDKRRFSDPCLNNNNNISNSNIGYSESSIDECASEMSTSEGCKRLTHTLLQQMQRLRDANRILSRDMLDLKCEMNVLRQKCLKVGSQMATHSDYEPGMLADIVREVRDAAKVREDALLAKIKHMIDENQFSMSQLSLMQEKQRNFDRISKLEEQLKNLNIENVRSNELHSIEANTNSARQVLELEREALELRRELQDTRAKKEEADHKILQLDKKLATILQRNSTTIDATNGNNNSNNSTSNGFDDEKKLPMQMSAPISSSRINANSPQQPPLLLMSSVTPRITLSGPVTDL